MARLSRRTEGRSDLVGVDLAVDVIPKSHFIHLRGLVDVGGKIGGLWIAPRAREDFFPFGVVRHEGVDDPLRRLDLVLLRGGLGGGELTLFICAVKVDEGLVGRIRWDAPTDGWRSLLALPEVTRLAFMMYIRRWR